MKNSIWFVLLIGAFVGVLFTLGILQVLGYIPALPKLLRSLLIALSLILVVVLNH